MTAVLLNYSSKFHLSRVTRDQISIESRGADQMDEKEHADRMAAAEALGALSSVAVVNNLGNPHSIIKQTSNCANNSRTLENGKARRKSKRGDEERETTKSGSRVKSRATKSEKPKRRQSQKESIPSSPPKSTTNEKVKKPRKSTKKNSLEVVATEHKPNDGCKQSDRGKQPIFEIPSLNMLHSGDLLKTPSQPNIPSLPSIPSLILPSFSMPSLGSLPTLGSLTFLNDIQAGPRTFAKSVLESSKADSSAATGDSSSVTDKFLPFKKRRLVTGESGRESSPTPSKHYDSSCRESSAVLTKQPSSSGRENHHATQNEKKDAGSATTELHLSSFQEQLTPHTQLQLLREINAVLSPDEDGDLPLHLAVVHEHLPLVEKFIKLMKIARKSVDKFNKDKQTPLHLAVKLNFLPAVQSLLEAGADVNFVDKTGCTSLHLAVKHQLNDCLKCLCRYSKHEDLDINTRNFDGLTPLHTAVENHDVEMVGLLLDVHADVNMVDGKSGRSPLFHAAENNHLNIVDLLLQRGANPALTNYAGITALMSSQARNLTAMSKILGIALDDVDSRSNSPAPREETRSELDTGEIM